MAIVTTIAQQTALVFVEPITGQFAAGITSSSMGVHEEPVIRSNHNFTETGILQLVYSHPNALKRINNFCGRCVGMIFKVAIYLYRA